MSEVTRERDRDLDRLLTFVDAIVAIAITLLVLPLVELTTDIDPEAPVGRLLRENGSDIWSFVLSFAVISSLWSAQHRAVRSLVRPHPRVARLLMLWALTIVFLPFPTALIAKTVDQPTTKILYVGTIALSALLISDIDATISRHPELCDGTLPSPVPGLVTVGILAVALVIMLAVPAVSYWPMALLFLSGAVQQAVRRITSRGSG